LHQGPSASFVNRASAPNTPIPFRVVSRPQARTRDLLPFRHRPPSTRRARGGRDRGARRARGAPCGGDGGGAGPHRARDRRPPPPRGRGRPRTRGASPLSGATRNAPHMRALRACDCRVLPPAGGTRRALGGAPPGSLASRASHERWARGPRSARAARSRLDPKRHA